ncbi:MAG: flagellar protein FlgN [Clostridia bacterium]
MARPGEGPVREVAARETGELSSLLEQQAELVSQLLSVAREKTRAILEQDSGAIQEATAAETRLVQGIQALEERRLQWVDRWAKARGFSPEGRSVTLSDVLSQVTASEAASLRSAADALAGALEELLQVNRQNADLLYYSLAHVQALLGALAGDPASSGVYSPAARRGDVQPQALVDWRV